MDRGNYNFRPQCRLPYKQLLSDFRELFGAVPLVKLLWWRHGRCMDKAWPFGTPCDSACSSSGPEVLGVRALLFPLPSLRLQGNASGKGRPTAGCHEMLHSARGATWVPGWTRNGCGALTHIIVKGEVTARVLPPLVT